VERHVGSFSSLGLAPFAPDGLSPLGHAPVVR
jgi:hypothetical protein